MPNLLGVAEQPLLGLAYDASHLHGATGNVYLVVNTAQIPLSSAYVETLGKCWTFYSLKFPIVIVFIYTTQDYLIKLEKLMFNQVSRGSPSSS